MADENPEKQKPQEGLTPKQEVDLNPDLEEATSGMVDLSDILTGGNPEDNLSASIGEKIEEISEEDGEVDPFEDALNRAAAIDPITPKDLSLFFRIKNKLIPIDSPQRKIIFKFIEKFRKGRQNSLILFSRVKVATKKFLQEDLKQNIEIAKKQIHGFISSLSKKIKQYWGYSWKLKLSFLGLLAFTYVLFLVLQKASHGRLVPEIKDLYVSNFNERADQIYDVPPGSPWEEFRNPLRFPEYIVKLERLIVVLKVSKNSSSSPMAVSSVYFEASSQEAAIEIKQRESEIRDISARTLEEMTYDSLRTAEGKAKAKILLAQNINRQINQGKIIKVYFKEFVVKP